MKNKLVFRILGALASALIVVSVFIPFISVAGYSTSLWESFEATNSLYLPVMIIVFGAIGVIFFSLNIKTEFAYMSTGAITFFLVMQTIDIINQGAFNTLSIGYYLLILGTVLTGLMSFLTNLKSKNKKEQTLPNSTFNESSLANQIDQLYSGQNLPQNETLPIQPIANVVEPIPVQSINVSQSIPIEPIVNTPEPIVTIEQSVEQIPNEVPLQPIPLVQEVAQPINPVIQEFSNQAQSNPATQEFTSQAQSNPATQEFSNQVQSNSVMNEFPMPQVDSQQAIQQQVGQPPITPQQNSLNPVLNQFTNSTSTIESQQPSGLDIFGQ